MLHVAACRASRRIRPRSWLVTRDLPTPASPCAQLQNVVRRFSAPTSSLASSSPPPLSASDARFLDELLERERSMRVEVLLAQHGFCPRRGARQFLRAHDVTILWAARKGRLGEVAASLAAAAAADAAAGGKPAAEEADEEIEADDSPPASSHHSLLSPSSSSPVRVLTGATRVDPLALRIDGAPLPPHAGLPLHVALHKPPGYVCSTSVDEGPTVYDLLPPDFLARTPLLSCVGRLDRMATGLLLFTQNGALNTRLTSPSRHCAKEYVVTLREELSADGREARAFASGQLELADSTRASPATLRAHKTNRRLCKVTLHEGKYHQVRRMFAAVGHEVVGIHRVSVGGLRMEAAPAEGNGQGKGEGRAADGAASAAGHVARPGPCTIHLAEGQHTLLGRKELTVLLANSARAGDGGGGGGGRGGGEAK